MYSVPPGLSIMPVEAIESMRAGVSTPLLISHVARRRAGPHLARRGPGRLRGSLQTIHESHGPAPLDMAGCMYAAGALVGAPSELLVEVITLPPRLHPLPECRPGRG